MFALSTCIGPGALAQDFPTRIFEPELKEGTVAEAEKALKESKQRTGLEPGADVTYEQVLANPDDLDLNYRYALSQVRKGNLRSAAATLERILMVNPNLPKVRLFYAIVLYRLDNPDDAERELGMLQSEKMPDTLRAEINGYLQKIRRRRRATHFNVLLGTGFDYNDNQNASPASGIRLFFDRPVILDSNSTRKSDTAVTELASLGVTHDLGYQAGHLLFVRYNYYLAEQTHQKILNLQNHAVEAGGVYKTHWVDVAPSFEFGHLLLAQSTYLRSRAAKLKFTGKITPRLGVFLETAYARQEYSRTPVVVTGSDRTGDKLEGGVGASFILTPTMNLSAGFTHINQGASAKFDAYRRESYQLGHTWLLGKGQFLFSSVTTNIDPYENPELPVSRNSRNDHTYRASVTYGVPVGLFDKRLQNMIWTMTFEYYDAYSRKIPNYSYSNNKFSTLLMYKWDL